MSKLIGTGPNQVPSNADLSSVAFMDKKEFLLSKGSNMSTVNAIIDKNSNDIFIYDTSLDSDGGAWRKKTQHTSWYNEPLNTTTRGSRRDFPSVALIVVQSVRITIYDADDPNLPMWMIADTNNNYFYESSPRKVAALNGRVVIGCDPYDASVVNFPRDRSEEYATGRITIWDEISRRNNPSATYKMFDYSRQSATYALLSRNIKNISMKVLPGAPIDPITRLEIPTIAVATDSALSLWKDDGITGHIDGYSSAWYDVVITEDGHVAGARDSQGVYILDPGYFPSDSATNENTAVNGPTGRRYQNAYDGFGVPIIYNDVDTGTRVAYGDNHLYVSQSDGLSIVYENHNDYTKGLACMIKDNYNTGWQVGDAKICTLTTTDTDDFDERATNLAQNGEFDSSDLSMYTITSDEGGSNSFSVSGGTVTFTVSAAGNYASRYQLIPVEAGVTYQITTNVTASSGSNARVDCGRNGANGTFYPSYLNNGGELFLAGTNTDGSATNGSSPVGVHTGQFVCTTSGNIRVGFRVYQNGSITADYIRVTPIAAEDTSILNPMGFHGIGRLKRTPVAPGSDIVSYSGFTENDYLSQPFLTSLDFGTGEYSFSGWIKTTGTGTVYQRGSADGSETIRIYIASSNYGVYFDYGSGGGYCYLSLATDRAQLEDGNWHHIVCAVAAGGAPKIYVDGYSRSLSIAANAPSTFMTGSNFKSQIGRSYDGFPSPFPGEIALIRVSGTIPSDHQVEKMFNDEKRLFLPNAQGALYGDSSDINAIDYDTRTKLFHAGTSAGRSVFNGITRIENTTTGVTTALSARNGMVAED